MIKNNSEKSVGKNKGVAAVEIVQEDLRNKIYTIRGKQVMLDKDLAEIYGYSTSAFNQQVKNNIERFDGEDFMFEIGTDDEEWPLISKILISIRSSRSRGGRTKPIRAFTEQGVYMLMTVLKGEIAVKQSRMLVMAFKAMKDYIVENKMLLDRRENLSITAKILDNAEQISDAKKKIEKIDAKVSKIADEMSNVVKRTEVSPVFLDFNRLAENKEYLLFEGEPIVAKEAYMDIYKHAKKKIYIVDNYIGIKTLHLLQVVKQNLEVVFFTDNVRNYLRKSDLDDFKKERPDLTIKFIRTKGVIHDRFIILDEKKAYQSGGSSKDAGNKMTAIHEILDDFIFKNLLSKIQKMKQNPELKLK